jgi:hypothetical protein
VSNVTGEDDVPWFGKVVENSSSKVWTQWNPGGGDGRAPVAAPGLTTTPRVVDTVSACATAVGIKINEISICLIDFVIIFSNPEYI